MLIVINNSAFAADLEDVVERVEPLSFQARPIPGSLRTAIRITGNQGAVSQDDFQSLNGIAKLIAVSQPLKLVGREMKPENTVIKIDKSRYNE